MKKTNMKKIRMKNKYKRGGLSGLILDYLLMQLHVPVTMLFYPRSEMYKIFNATSYDNRRRINQALGTLRMNKLIKVEGVGPDTRIVLLPLKNKKRNYIKFNQIKIKQSGKWDGKWRVIIFDIPEYRKNIRDRLAKKLKEIGFKSIQKSIFVYPFKCKEEIEIIKAHLSLDSELIYMVVEKIENDKKLKKLFSL